MSWLGFDAAYETGRSLPLKELVQKYHEKMDHMGKEEKKKKAVILDEVSFHNSGIIDGSTYKTQRCLEYIRIFRKEAVKSLRTQETEIAMILNEVEKIDREEYFVLFKDYTSLVYDNNWLPNMIEYRSWPYSIKN